MAQGSALKLRDTSPYTLDQVPIRPPAKLTITGLDRAAVGRGRRAPRSQRSSHSGQFTQRGHIPAHSGGGGGHFCGRVARLATSQGLLHLSRTA